MSDCGHIELIADDGRILKGDAIEHTHSYELMGLSETIGSAFIELCDYIACYDLFESEVTEANIYSVIMDSIQLIDKSYIISCYPFFNNGNIIVSIAAKLEGAPKWVKYARETFSTGEIIAHSVQSKDDRYAQLGPDDELRPDFNRGGSLLHSPDIERWLNGEP